MIVKDISELEETDSNWKSVRQSVKGSVMRSLRDSVDDFARWPIPASVWNSVCHFVMNSAGQAIRGFLKHPVNKT